MASIIQTISKEELLKIVQESFSLMQVLNKLNLSGRGHSYDYLKIRLKKDEIDYNHFGKYIRNKYDSLDDILKKDSTYKSLSLLKIKLFKNKLKENKCEICNQLPFHQDKLLVLQLDHMDGDHTNHSLDNLRILCPNCHSQTHTYSGKNKQKNDKIKIIEGKKEIIEKRINRCKKCDKEIGKSKYQMCKNCFYQSDEGREQLKKITESQTTKFQVTKEELEKLVHEKPMTEIGKMFGVTDNAIRKRCKRFGIVIPKIKWKNSLDNLKFGRCKKT